MLGIHCIETFLERLFSIELAAVLISLRSRKAGLAIVDSGGIPSATHTSEIVPIFAGRLDIHRLNPVVTFGAYSVNLEYQKLIALVGRDLVASCVLVYNGTDNSFSLSL